MTLSAQERDVRAALLRAGLKDKEAAALVGVSRTTFWRRLGAGKLLPAQLRALEAVTGPIDGQVVQPMVQEPRTPYAARPTFAEHVLVTAGRIIQLAESIAQGAANQVAVSSALALRAEQEQRGPGGGGGPPMARAKSTDHAPAGGRGTGARKKGGRGG